MCGIVGVVSASPVDAGLVLGMRDQLSHRGPDGAGLWCAEDGRVVLGHRRLAVLDLSPEANQPFQTSDGRFVITYNGEIYNHARLRRQLIARGIHFRTRSDTEVLLEAYRAWGEGCLGKLSGMFAFAIWDRVTRQLFCARDLAGEKPFYYARVGTSFVFGSELKALLLHPDVHHELHYPGLIDYLSFGFVADPKTIWEGCFKLPPGHAMTVYLNGEGSPVASEPRAYWDWEFEPDYAVRDWGAPILDTLQGASQEMACADVPVGTFLSGGVDSSSVVAALARSGTAVNSYTIGFEEASYDERPWARQVAELYHTHHFEKVVRAADVKPVLQQLVWHYDEPFNDFSYLPTYYVCREARQYITVALSGDGGDELFAGYRKYQRARTHGNMRRVIPQRIATAAVAGANLLLDGTSQLHEKLNAYARDSSRFLLDTFTTGFDLDALRPAARGDLAHAMEHYHPMDALGPVLRRAPLERVGLVNAMRYCDLKLTLAGDMLVKVDRASMAVSLEVRPVLLHKDMLALAARIPPEQLVTARHSKQVYKEALAPWLPRSVLRRPKQGFALPLSKWLEEGSLALQAPQDRSSQLEELLDVELLHSLIRRRSESGRDTSLQTHSLFFLGQWLARWVR